MKEYMINPLKKIVKQVVFYKDRGNELLTGLLNFLNSQYLMEVNPSDLCCLTDPYIHKESFNIIKGEQGRKTGDVNSNRKKEYRHIAV